MNRIFISSTCYDCIDLRAEIAEELRGLGLTPVLSERPDSDFEVDPASDSIQSCLQNIERCDVVLVVLNQRYGRLLSKGGYPEVSATHLEVRHARDHKKPIYYFIRDRLLRDMQAVESGQSVSSLKWVKSETDTRLFDMIKEITKLNANGPSNWIDIFQDSVELRQQIRLRLKQVSGKAQISKLIDSNRLPNLYLWIESENLPSVDGGAGGIMKGLKVHASARNGDIYSLEVMYGHGYCDQICLQQGFLAESHENIAKIDAVWNPPHPKPHTLLKSRYKTVQGHEIRDEWRIELRPWVNGVSLEKREVTPGNMSFIKIIEPG